ncbi:DNA mismatch repair protein MutS [Paenibacillus senegalensis]|uniref:DNA mismatch repair protein MutS n=1 Tax=Paenibacillus senegalensis TaxID=1465766 RepID=UPI0005A647EC|nr:DNA mismatch repair protein MutS [Paenibacillus senegalensis]
MIQQYLSVKSGVQDALLFFRLGDFYELFFEDAKVASRELELTLTGRDGGAKEKIPMCGVPYHSADGYIARLIEKGFKVAICEQVENPQDAKGIVRREVVKVVTPGTFMDNKQAGTSQNNYITALAVSNGEYALASCDLSTGELYATSFSSSLEQLLDEVSVYSPAEIVGAPTLLAEVRALYSHTKIPIYTERESAGSPGGRPLAAASELTGSLTGHASGSQGHDYDPLSRFQAGDVQSLNDAEQASVALLMSYLQETQKRALDHIERIQRYEPDQYMVMDPFTRRNLELVETVRDRSKKGSLLWLLDRTVTAMGARMLRRWIEKPLMNKQSIEDRLEAVECLHNQMIVREDIRSQLKEVYDLERLVGRICYGNANGRDLAALRQSLRQVPHLKELCLHSGSSTLRRLVRQMDDCGDVLELIAAAIVDDPPVSVREGGLIKKGYHEHLDKLREADTSGKQWIAELERKEREATGIKSLKIGYNKVFGYYIEVTRANLSLLPEGRYERKQTLANAERFITAELKEKEALILEAQEKMVLIEYDLFTQLREEIAAHRTRLQQLAATIASVDTLQSLAVVSASHRFTRPAISENGDMVVKEGRHPVVESVLKEQSFVANDTVMEMDTNRVLLITGPNMAGKSTYMRQVAMISIMAQMGSFVPAEQAAVPITDRIFTRIGAADDLIGGQSTFMVEMMDIQAMTAKATPRSLVIIDELGRGTSTGEGMAIAQAVIEYLHDQIGCKTLVSTHFHELAHLEDSLTYLHNYSMAVKESGRQVTFLRKLVPGAASTSYGIYCAQIAGLPESIISRSYALLSTFEARAVDYGGEANQGRKEMAAARDDAQEIAHDNAYGNARDNAHDNAQGNACGNAHDNERLAQAGRSPEAVQLSFFGDTESLSSAESKLQKKSYTAERNSSMDLLKEDSSSGEIYRVVEQLKQADLINMTPLQAMNLLYELKQKL